jgi:uncharacterized MAPEG superfamily protein
MSASRSSVPRVVVALARVEGRKVIGNPAFLAGVAFAIIGSGVFVKASLAPSGVSWDDEGWTVFVGFVLLGVLTMVAANHATLRDRREHTEEQHGTLPVGARARTGGLLAAMLWPAVVAAVLLVGVVGVAATRGIVADGAEALQLTERVYAIVMLGSLGIAIASWIPSPFVAPLVAWALLFLTPGEAARSWHSLTPFASMRAAELATWHLTYLVGLTAIFATVALARSGKVRSLLLPGAVAIAVAVTSGVILLTRACPVDGACLL